MYFAVWSTNRPGFEQARLNLLHRFAAYLRNQADHPDVTLHHAGPTLADDGGFVVGTLLVVEAPSLQAVREFVAASPFGKADLLAETSVRPLQWWVKPAADAQGMEQVKDSNAAGPSVVAWTAAKSSSSPRSSRGWSAPGRKL